MQTEIYAVYLKSSDDVISFELVPAVARYCVYACAKHYRPATSTELSMQRWQNQTTLFKPAAADQLALIEKAETRWTQSSAASGQRFLSCEKDNPELSLSLGESFVPPYQVRHVSPICFV